MRDVRDEGAPPVVLRRERVHLRADPIRHPTEVARQRADLVVPGGQAHVLAALEARHALAQPLQRSNERAHREVAGRTGREEADQDQRERLSRAAALEEVGRDRVVEFAPEDDVDVSLALALVQPRDTDGLPSAEVARVVTEDRPAPIAAQGLANRCEVDALAHHDFLGSVEGEDAPLEVEQVDLERGVHDHRLHEHVLRRVEPQLPFFEEAVAARDVLGDVDVQLVLQLRGPAAVAPRLDREHADRSQHEHGQHDERQLRPERTRHALQHAHCSPPSKQ